MHRKKPTTDMYTLKHNFNHFSESGIKYKIHVIKYHFPSLVRLLKDNF